MPTRAIITPEERKRLAQLVRRTEILDIVLHESMHEACAILGVSEYDHRDDVQVSEANRVYDAIIGLDTPIDELLAQLNITVVPTDT